MKTMDELLCGRFDPALALEKYPESISSSLAVVVVDMQDYFLRDAGGYPFFPQHVQKMIDYQEEVLRLAREKCIPVFLLEYEGKGNTIERIKKLLEGYLLYFIIPKDDNDGFRETTLEMELRNHDARGFVITGVNASACVFDTACSGIGKKFNVLTSPSLITNVSGCKFPVTEEWFSRKCAYFKDHQKLLEVLRR